MTIRELKENTKTLVEVYQNTRYGSPEKTVDDFIAAVGKENAIATFAAVVVSVGDWDERVCGRNRAWAYSKTVFSLAELNQACYYKTSEIHSAHIDQIADIFRKRFN